MISVHVKLPPRYKMCNYILTSIETQQTWVTDEQRGRMRTRAMLGQWSPIHIRKTERVSGVQAVPRHAKAQEGTQKQTKEMRWFGLSAGRVRHMKHTLERSSASRQM